MAKEPSPELKKVKIEHLTSADFEMRVIAPKILLLDIETAANVGSFWRNPWQTNIIETIEDTYMLSWSIKWIDGRRITRSLPDYKGYKPHVRNDKALVTELCSLLEQADMVVAHNGRKFDIPYTKGRAVINGLQPVRHVKIYDTRDAAKRHFGFTSNKQDDIARMLGIERKIPIHYDSWKGCEAGDPKAWKLMTKYNAHDVWMLEQIYLRFRAWDPGHPNLNVLMNRSFEGCPSCGSTETRKRGFNYTTTGRRQEYECMDAQCGRRFSGKHQAITTYR